MRLISELSSKKPYFYILYFLSLFFLLAYLANQDTLTLLTPVNFKYFIISFVFLFLGFILQSLAWMKSFTHIDKDLSVKWAVASTGASIFAKYIPGKIWVILGRAQFISAHKNWPLGETSYISLISQSFSIISGCLLGLYAAAELFVTNITTKQAIIAISLLAIGSILFLFIGKKYGFYRPKPIPTANIILYSILTWASWSIGFAFFAYSFGASDFWLLASIFSAGALIGILAIFVPGGIGVRESIIASLLVTSGESLDLSVSISVLARLWFIAGEAFIFVLGTYLAYKLAKQGDN